MFQRGFADVNECYIVRTQNRIVAGVANMTLAASLRRYIEDRQTIWWRAELLANFVRDVDAMDAVKLFE